jgi:hypothetical protein
LTEDSIIEEEEYEEEDIKERKVLSEVKKLLLTGSHSLLV